MPEYLIPGVFTEETSFSPKPINGVSTSITAFVGMTEHGPMNTPILVSSMTEFQREFGGAPHPLFRLEKHEPRSGTSPLSTDGADMPPELPEALFIVGSQTYALVQTNPAYALYAAARSYFVNGGGKAYVVRAGSYDDEFDSQKMLDAINNLKTEEQPSLIVVPEVTRLPRTQAATVNQAVLAHCQDIRSCFAIVDIPGGYLDRSSPRGDPITAFWDDIGTHALEYGAAYYPWLETTAFHPEDFTFDNIETDSRPLLESLLTAADEAAPTDCISAPTLTGDFTIVAKPGQTVKLTLGDFRAVDDSRAKNLRYSVLDTGQMTGRVITTGTTKRRTGFRQKGLALGKVSFMRHKNAVDPGQFEIVARDKDRKTSAQRTVFVVSSTQAAALPEVLKHIAVDAAGQRDDLRTQDRALRKNSPLYAEITRSMASYANTLPPGAAMAGVYARTDNARGVWKAPAGVSISGVVRPTVAIKDREQGDLNTPANGKSVNAIRTFTGRGILAWGARTMAGYDNEWRYVPVRRFAIMIENSLTLATQPFVFEENDAGSWSAIRAMANDFLTRLWRSGGLAGQRPSEGYFVKVGLGETMTEEDVLNGRLIVDIGIAPVRPAEFVIIRIQQKIQPR